MVENLWRCLLSNGPLYGLWMSLCGGIRLFDAVVGGIGSPPSDPGKEFFKGEFNFRNLPGNWPYMPLFYRERKTVNVFSKSIVSS